jgi:BirA family biotin operon repressor/biotin-[acetyl-CoA-carboxylase] ligase
LVIGVGLNVNNSFDEAPDELRDIATSLVDVTGQQTSLTDVLIQLLVELEHQWSRLAAGDVALVRDWQQRCALKGRSVEVGAGRRPISGVCHGIDDEGALLIRTDEGIEQVFGGVVTQIW